MEPVDHLFGHLHKDRVRLAGEHDPEGRNFLKPFCKVPGTAVCAESIAQPGAIGQKPDPRRREEPHLRCKLARLLASVVELGCERLIEEDDRFPCCQTVLYIPKAEHVDAGLPGDVLGRDLKGRKRIGETGAIHVNPQSQAGCKLAEGLDLTGGIDGPHFRCLGDADGPRLGIMNIGAFERYLLYFIKGDLSVPAPSQQYLGAIGKELRGAALICLDVGEPVTDDAVV